MHLLGGKPPTIFEEPHHLRTKLKDQRVLKAESCLVELLNQNIIIQAIIETIIYPIVIISHAVGLENEIRRNHVFIQN